MTVDPQRFAAAMTHRWISELRNVVNCPLQSAWIQMAETFNQHIAGEVDDRWSVLHPPTGTGKTEGLKLYCTMLPEENNPGVLIVTRLKNEALEIANSINEIAQKHIAEAHYATHKLSEQIMQNTPVLIITHRAYEISLENISDNSDSVKWLQLCEWKNGARRLVVIDEALNVLKPTSTHFDELQAARGHIPLDIASQHADEVEALDNVLKRMGNFIVSNTNKEGRLIDAGYWHHNINMDFTGLLAAIKKVKLDENVLGKRSREERTGLAEKFDKTLSALTILAKNWSWYALKGKQHTFSTASIIVPTGKMNAVVLDATASSNPLYSLLGRKVVLISPPKEIRNYRNVTIHAAIGHRVGKGALTANADKDCPTFVANLQNEISKNRNVFVCAHKLVKPYLQGYESYFNAYDVENWGAIDGLNKWKDFDTAVIYGLPYLEPVQSEITLLAVEQWLEKKFPLEKRMCFRKKLNLSYLIVPLVQAINRIRCRNMVNQEGDCETTDIYIPLSDVDAEKVLLGIRKEMSGVAFKEWELSVVRRKQKRSNYEAPLISYLKSLKRGEHPAREAQKTLGIAKRTFESLIAKLKKEGTALWAELQDTGVSYQVRGTGRKAESYFVVA